MAITVEVTRMFNKPRRLARLLVLLLAFAALLFLFLQFADVKHHTRIDRPRNLIDSVHYGIDAVQQHDHKDVTIQGETESPTVQSLNPDLVDSSNMDIPKKGRKVLPRNNMEVCEPIYGRVTVFTAMDQGSVKVRYGLAQRSLECYLASTNYTLVQVNLDTDERVKKHCKHKTTYFKKHCAAALYLEDTDWMLVLDADTGVINPNHCLEEYIDDRVDMIFYERFFNWEVACGNYIVKNTAQSRQFLMEYANMESEPHAPGVWLGFDNGPLQILILKQVMPFAQHIIDTCNQIWHSSKNYNQYTAYLLCVKMALGEQRLWPGKLRIYKRAHAWVRDGWLTSNEWTDFDFMIHGWKIEDMKNATQFASPFTQDFNVTQCGLGYSGWHFELSKKKTMEQIKKMLFNYEKKQMKSHPVEGRTPYFLTVPDVGECYPHCEDF
ncbi:hypothetical protein QR680_000969 [Steinernema hermaphroditum]|uniref:Nucleotide-diphospho-sugar transferase domain-containing protein n=1 Tax=Steinernema hermaphroditum TaxID=289476 RepID=A0AA39GYH9_9BILA|nr:hypothetical protein QR680_000969 [Steinernema hermaphroditum]